MTITATVSPAGPPAPTGTVSFTSNGTAISGCTAVPLTSSLTAVCTTSTLAVGTDAIVATYSGDTQLFRQQRHALAMVNPIPSPLQFVAVDSVPCGGHAPARRQRPDSGRHLRKASRTFPLAQSGTCDIPSNAVAYSLNVTVVPHGTAGIPDHLADGRRPAGSLDHELAGWARQSQCRDRSRRAASGAVSVYVTNTTDVVLDIDGYFAPVSGSTLAFYPLTPCRVVDTRNGTFPPGLGPPSAVCRYAA